MLPKRLSRRLSSFHFFAVDTAFSWLSQATPGFLFSSAVFIQFRVQLSMAIDSRFHAIFSSLMQDFRRGPPLSFAAFIDYFHGHISLRQHYRLPPPLRLSAYFSPPLRARCHYAAFFRCQKRRQRFTPLSSEAPLPHTMPARLYVSFHASKIDFLHISHATRHHFHFFTPLAIILITSIPVLIFSFFVSAFKILHYICASSCLLSEALHFIFGMARLSAAAGCFLFSARHISAVIEIRCASPLIYCM